MHAGLSTYLRMVQIHHLELQHHWFVPWQADMNSMLTKTESPRPSTKATRPRTFNLSLSTCQEQGQGLITVSVVHVKL